MRGTQSIRCGGSIIRRQLRSMRPLEPQLPQRVCALEDPQPSRGARAGARLRDPFAEKLSACLRIQSSARSRRLAPSASPNSSLSSESHTPISPCRSAKVTARPSTAVSPGLPTNGRRRGSASRPRIQRSFSRMNASISAIAAWRGRVPRSRLHRRIARWFAAWRARGGSSVCRLRAEVGEHARHSPLAAGCQTEAAAASARGHRLAMRASIHSSTDRFSDSGV